MSEEELKQNDWATGPVERCLLGPPRPATDSWETKWLVASRLPAESSNLESRPRRVSTEESAIPASQGSKPRGEWRWELPPAQRSTLSHRIPS